MPSLRDSRDALGRLPVATRLAWGFGFLVALLMVLTCAGLLLLGQDPALQSQRQMLGLIGSAAMVAAGMVAWLMVDSLKWPLDRTLDFADEFGEVMTLADIAVINDVCGAREDPIPGVTGQLVVDTALAHGAKEVVYVVEKYDLPAALNEIARPGDLIITLGCGDVTIVGPLLATLLKERPEAARP